MEIQDILVAKAAPEIAKRGISDKSGELFRDLLKRSVEQRGNDDTSSKERPGEVGRPDRRDKDRFGNDHPDRLNPGRSDDRAAGRSDRPARESTEGLEVSDASDPAGSPYQSEDSGCRQCGDEDSSADETVAAASADTNPSASYQSEKPSADDDGIAIAHNAQTALPVPLVDEAAGAETSTAADQTGAAVGSPTPPGTGNTPAANAASPVAEMAASAGAGQRAAQISRNDHVQASASLTADPGAIAEDSNSQVDSKPGQGPNAASTAALTAESVVRKTQAQTANPAAVKLVSQDGQSQGGSTSPHQSREKGAAAKTDTSLGAQFNANGRDVQNLPASATRAPGSALPGTAAAAPIIGTPDMAPAGATQTETSSAAPVPSDGGNILLTVNREGSTSAIHARTAQVHGVPINDIAVHIRRAVTGGEDHLRIRLHPAELGEVDVRLKIGRDGAVRVVVSVDRPETFDLMQRDARGLERALQDAGLKTDSGSLSFSLRDNGPGGFAGREDGSHADPSQSTSPDGSLAVETADPDIVVQFGMTTRALDIRV